MSYSRIIVGALALLGVAACAPGAGEAPPPRPTPASATADARTSPASEIDGIHLSGDGPRTLAEAEGKVVVLHFWASYCDPCRRSLSRYQALQERYPTEVAVIGVGIDEPGEGVETAVDRFAGDVDVRFPLVWDRAGTVKAAYRPRHLPSTYVIDRAGTLRFVHARDEAGTDDMVAHQIEALLER